MNTAFVTTKYASWREAAMPLFKKASSWVREHRRMLSGTTSLVAVVAVGWVLSAHGGWHALVHTKVTFPWHLVAVLALWPLNLGLEVAKWRRLSAAVGLRPWREAWKEVLAGQTWGLLGPFRLADGLGRMAASRSQRIRSLHGAQAFAWGAAAQGWATWFYAVPALVMWRWHVAASILILVLAVSGYALLRRGAGWRILALSLARYFVFATQYVLCLTGWGALPQAEVWTHGFPNVAAVWCATSAIPWPAELGVREAAAVWAFDDRLPNVVVATFFLWLINRVGSALLGALFLMPKR